MGTLQQVIVKLVRYCMLSCLVTQQVQSCITFHYNDIIPEGATYRGILPFVMFTGKLVGKPN